MSINSAMLAGVSGLLANSSSLAAISDNIANVNTVGYKRTTANFSSMVTSQSASGTYSAGGVKSQTHQFISQQGLSQSTTSPLDLSISGSGFFVTTDKAEGLTPTDTRSFTRAGSFTLDNLGYLKNDAGLYLQGWLADPITGMITTDPSDLSRLSSINVATVGGAAEKTTRVGVNANLRSEQPVSAAAKAVVAKTGVPESPSGTADYTVTYSPTGAGDQYEVSVSRAGAVISTGVASYDPATGALTGYVPDGSTTPVTTLTSGGQTVNLTDLGMGAKADAVAAGAYDPASRSMADYAKDPTTGVKPDFEIQIPVSDSKGGQRTITLSLLKGPGPNEWFAEVRAKPGDLDNNANGLISSGMVTFTTDGKLASVGNLFGGSNPASISIGASDPAATGSGPRWADGLGIDAQDIQIDLANAAGGLTQYNSQSVVQSVNTNGTAFGNLTNVEVDAQGYVTAIFDNGVTRRIAQVAIATFSNPDGLKAVNGNAYRVTNESGGYSLKAPGDGGAGSIDPSTLEASTVDLSTEFTGLITTQRAYSACSKIITTADQMLEELLSIKR
ncbi:MAG: flagellar hook protein FlgE [Caulobacter sp.]|nr:flagellar hook protein FlgE [Caulobacter sp.]